MCVTPCEISCVRTLIPHFRTADTEHEKDKFFADAMFLATNLTNGHTFSDVLPVMNFWAGFSPSAQVRLFEL